MMTEAMQTKQKLTLRSPANAVDWPPRCEAVLRKVVPYTYSAGTLRVFDVAHLVELMPRRFLAHANFGPRSLERMRAIIETIENGEEG